jgi:mRNA-degrading endonuclease RelE of RelBE toxin-antitoxin system
MAAYEIALKHSAIADLDALRKFDAAQIADAMEKHLRHDPTKESKSRIKRLRGLSSPDYRLRVGDYRVFYAVDKDGRRVDVLRVMHKDRTASYYEELKR